MDDYVFGCVKDDESNVIPRLENARGLLVRLSSSTREFELIFCCEGPEALKRIGAEAFEPLGYDVAAVKADYWSIVDDFAPSGWADPFRASLNEHGLFENRADAESYLDQYRGEHDADADAPFDVILVARVRL